jgi:VPDSG-CTERM motif
MKKTLTAKTILVLTGTFALAASAVHAGTITRVSPTISGFVMNSGTSSNQTQTGGDLLTTNNFVPTTVAGSGSNFGPASGGAGTGATIQPLPSTGPVIDAPRLPDSGSTAALLGLALLGLAVLRRRLTAV